jgi:hypothetical protein
LYRQRPASNAVLTQNLITMDASPLSKLPAEIRNEIYELAVIESDGIVIDLWAGIPQVIAAVPSDGNKYRVGGAGLMMACKEARADSTPTFYGANIFVVRTNLLEAGDDDDDDEPALPQLGYKVVAYMLRGWLHELGQHSSLLRNVEIDLGTWYPRRVFSDRKSPSDIFSMTTAFRRPLVSSSINVTFKMVVNWGASGFRRRRKAGFVLLIDSHDLEKCKRVFKSAMRVAWESCTPEKWATIRPKTRALEKTERTLGELFELIEGESK